MNGNISAKDQQFYKKLYLFQDAILQAIFKKTRNHNFYLTGGTALNRFYFPARYSDDLDFFNPVNKFFREDLKNYDFWFF